PLWSLCRLCKFYVDSVVELYGLPADISQDSSLRTNKLKKVRYSPKLVSLFSGCGGLDKGFEDAGYKRVWANDFDPDAQAVFRLNLSEIDGRDITQALVEYILE